MPGSADSLLHGLFAKDANLLVQSFTFCRRDLMFACLRCGVCGFFSLLAGIVFRGGFLPSPANRPEPNDGAKTTARPARLLETDRPTDRNQELFAHLNLNYPGLTAGVSSSVLASPNESRLGVWLNSRDADDDVVALFTPNVRFST